MATTFWKRWLFGIGEDPDEPNPSGSWFYAALALLALLGVTYGMWARYRRPPEAANATPLTLDQLEIRPETPAWIRSDVKRESFVSGSLMECRDIDPRLTRMVYDAFAMHPWVQKVHRVRMDTSRQITVTVEYRRPVAVVEVDASIVPVASNGATDGSSESANVKYGVLPIDSEGVILPHTDFDLDTAIGMPRIFAHNIPPQGNVGSHYGDSRITHAARIIVMIGHHWSRMGLLRVVTPDSPVPGAVHTVPTYYLVTKKETRILWGSPPGEELRGEPTADQKVEFLHELANQVGSLESHPALDLRDVTRQAMRNLRR